MSELDYTRYCDQRCNNKWLLNKCFNCEKQNSIIKRKCLKSRNCEKTFEICVYYSKYNTFCIYVL